jgi:hypothetical protein
VAQVARVVEVEAGQAGVGIVHLDGPAEAVARPGGEAPEGVGHRGDAPQRIAAQLRHESLRAEPLLDLDDAERGEPLGARRGMVR